ncbi:hypothetical protein DFH28DRAFT_1031968, partial [Melampsora americana]
MINEQDTLTIKLNSTLSDLNSNLLPQEFITNLKEIINRSSKSIPLKPIQIHLNLKDLHSKEINFKTLQKSLLTIYLQSERFKSELNNPLIEITVKIDDLNEIKSNFLKTYSVVALGGTFDHLHSGHKILLTMATFLSNQKIIVGITDDNLLINKKYKSELQSLKDRTNSVKGFLNQISFNSLEILTPALKDLYGPTATDPNIQALIVSHETLSGADQIDQIRLQNGFPVLERFVIDLINLNELNDENQELKEIKMSSTEIRKWIYDQR